MQTIFRFCFIFLLGIQTIGVKNATASEGFEENVEEGGFKTIRAQESGQLTSIHVQENQWVDAGQVLGCMEQMKMKRPIVAPYSGYVTKIFINPPLETRPYPLRSLEPIFVLKRVSQPEPVMPTPPTTPNPSIGQENGDGEPTSSLAWVYGEQSQPIANAPLALDGVDVETDSVCARGDSVPLKKASLPLVPGFFFSFDFFRSYLLPSRVNVNLGQGVPYERPFRGAELETSISSRRSESALKNREEVETSHASAQQKLKDTHGVQGNRLPEKARISARVFLGSALSDSYVPGIASKAGGCGFLASVDPLLKGLFFQIHLPSVHMVMWSWVLLFALLLAQEESFLLKLSRRFSSKHISRRGAVFHHVGVIQNSNFNRRIKLEVLKCA